MINQLKASFNLILIMCSMAYSAVHAQDKLITRTGHISFFSEAPLENIEAHNQKVLSILDMHTGEVAVSVSIKNFEFKKALMQEHFNENYMESDKFPQAILKARIENWDKIDLNKIGNKVLETNISGEITIHGVTKPFNSKVYFSKNGNYINGKSKFKVKVKDFDVEIPRILLFNIAEEVEVTVDFNYEPYTPRG